MTKTDPRSARDTAPLLPPQHVVDFAVEVSGYSPCRSKRGCVIFRGDDIIVNGYNFKPRGFDCDGSLTCKSTCRLEAVHAEQMALLLAGVGRASGAEMIHVKTVNGQLVPSGGPSCPQCSKLALAAGIAAMWLYHEDGWRRYPAPEWHRLSLDHAREARGARDPAPLLCVQVERATVYRVVGGRRYFTKVAALRGYAKARFRRKHPCECEQGDYSSGYGGYTCHVHDTFDRVMPRYLRMLKRRVK